MTLYQHNRKDSQFRECSISTFRDHYYKEQEFVAFMIWMYLYKKCNVLKDHDILILYMTIFFFKKITPPNIWHLSILFVSYKNDKVQSCYIKKKLKPRKFDKLYKSRSVSKHVRIINNVFIFI